MKKIINVITECVKKSLCSGCGICAGIAEKCDLKMGFNKYGEFVPVVTNCNNCGLCLSVCAFYHGNAIRNDSLSPLGEYIESFLGYSKVGDERFKGSSGGLATRVLKALLEKKLVSGVIVIGKSNNEDRIFEPVIARTPQEIDSCAGSKYYPIEFSSVLRKIEKENGNFAVVGLPCVINGLRLVQQKYPKVGRRIKYLLGLVCGHNKSKNYASFLARLMGINEKDIETILFRCKENTGKAINYGFKTILKNGKEGAQLKFQDSLVKDTWCGRYFSLSACFYCSDLFAEQADISFMDAWLKSYMDDPLGTSIIVNRNIELKDLVNEQKNKGNIKLIAISEADVIGSQRGALDFKNGIINKKNYLFNNRLSSIFYTENTIFKSLGHSMLMTYMHIIKLYKKLLGV